MSIFRDATRKTIWRSDIFNAHPKKVIESWWTLATGTCYLVTFTFIAFVASVTITGTSWNTQASFANFIFCTVIFSITNWRLWRVWWLNDKNWYTKSTSAISSARAPSITARTSYSAYSIVTDHSRWTGSDSTTSIIRRYTNAIWR